MKLKDLRQLIKEEVEAVLDEAEKASKTAPTSFADFRKRIAASLKAVGAPEQLVDQAEDVDYEGGHVASVLYDAWRNIELELKDGPNDWAGMVQFYVHDAVLDLADAVRGVNGPEVAEAVVQHLLTGKGKKISTVAMSKEGLITAVKGALKSTGLKTKPARRGAAGADSFVTVLAPAEQVLQALQPAFTKVGFEVEGNNLVKHIGYTGEATVAVEPDDESPELTVVWVTYNRGSGL